IGTMEGIESIESNLNNRSATIQVNFEKNVDTKYTFLKLQEKIDQVTDNIDENFIVTVNKVDIQQLTNQFMELQIRGTGGTDRLRNMVDIDILDNMEITDGVASVTAFGGKERSIEVSCDLAACDAYKITPPQLRNAINSNTRNRVFTGNLPDSKKQY